MREIEIAGAGGLRLCLCVWGEPSADRLPLVVLHGYLEQGAAWGAVAARLDRYVIAPDHRGHGRSEHVGPGGFYHFWDYVADVDAVVMWAGGRVDLCGHSMGGTMACLYAGARPDTVRRMALIEGLGPPDMVSLAVSRSRSFLKARRDPPGHRPMVDLDAAVERMRRFNPRLDDETARVLASRITVALPDGQLTWRWDPLHRAASPNPFDPRQFGLWLDAIEAPVLHLDGANSPFRIPDLDDRKARVRDLRSATIDSAGHLIHHDAPEALANALTDWFEAP